MVDDAASSSGLGVEEAFVESVVVLRGVIGADRWASRSCVAGDSIRRGPRAPDATSALCQSPVSAGPRVVETATRLSS